MAAVNMNTLPTDLLGEIGSFLPADGLFRLSQTNSSLRNRLVPLIVRFATREQQRMQVSTVPFQVPLTLDYIRKRWRQLTPRAFEELKNHLRKQPPVFYSELFNLALFLENSLRAAPGDSQRIAEQATGEENLRRAVLLAYNVPNENLRNLALQTLALRIGMPIENVLEIAHSITDEEIRNVTLRDLALRNDLSLAKALEIARSIPNEYHRSKALYHLAIRKTLPLKDALRIAGSISVRVWKDSAFHHIALREELPLEKALKIADHIPTRLWRDLTLRDLALRNDTPFEKAIEIINHICDEEIKRAALHIFTARTHRNSLQCTLL